MDYILVDRQQQVEDYSRIEQAIYYLEANARRQPELREVAAQVGLSEYHFQRLFTRWAGISPKRFLQFLTKESAKLYLAGAGNVLEAAYGSGLSGPGRLHDLMISTEAVSPGEFKLSGAGLRIAYGFHASPFGECLLALTERGICDLSFNPPGEYPQAVAELRKRWQSAELYQDERATRLPVEAIFAMYRGGAPGALQLYLRGTNFQLKVWEALLRIPPGRLTTYGALAASIGHPGAARAVGGAVSHNPVAVLIPCHRVIRKLGEFGGYRWGLARKKAILTYELMSAV
jgi:AraC family transcriptional regulator of adaptative response/methylated-DNA-[protein]-cysteine methyltransferase